MNTQIAIRTVEEFAAATRVSRSKLYQLPPELQPHSVKVGRRRLIKEQPQDWLERYSQATAPSGAPA